MLWCYGDYLLTDTHHSSRSSDHSPVKSRWQENQMRIRWEADEKQMSLRFTSWILSAEVASGAKPGVQATGGGQSRIGTMGRMGRAAKIGFWGMFGVRLALLYHALGHLLAQRTNRNKPMMRNIRLFWSASDLPIYPARCDCGKRHRKATTRPLWMCLGVEIFWQRNNGKNNRKSGRWLIWL